MPNHAMTPHVSGTTLEAQKRYAAGVRDSLENFIQGRPIRDDYVMVADGEIQSGSYKAIYG
jgi:formate dehydrogenase